MANTKATERFLHVAFVSVLLPGLTAACERKELDTYSVATIYAAVLDQLDVPDRGALLILQRQIDSNGQLPDSVSEDLDRLGYTIEGRDGKMPQTVMSTAALSDPRSLGGGEYLVAVRAATRLAEDHEWIGYSDDISYVVACAGSECSIKHEVTRVHSDEIPVIQ